MKIFSPAVYIMCNKRNGTIYIGVTTDLSKRALQHKSGLVSGFTKRYDCKLLVYYEQYNQITDAITREKQLKNKSRKHKLQLIESMNPNWIDLYEVHP